MKKKLMSVLLTAAMAVSLVACGSASDNNTTASNTSTGGDGKLYHVGICQLVQHEALDAATQGFKDALTEKLGEENAKVVFLEQNAAGDSATCSTITNQFVTDGVDLILANATAPLQAAASSTNQIPILGTSVTDYATALNIENWSGTTGTNISGTSDLAPLDEQAAMIKELFPDKKNIGILYCSAEPNSVYQSDVITKYLEDEGYSVKVYTFADSNDVASVTTSACGESDVLYIPTDNTAASCTEAINNVAINEGVPIIAGEEGICAGCGVATLSISYYDLGYTTGEMAYEILVNGKDVSTMEVQYAPKVTKKYNKDICDKLKIEIPDGYEAIAQ